MKRIFCLLAGIVCSLTHSSAQIETYVSKGEFGLGLGATAYQGDLNPYGKLGMPSPAANIFFQKYLNNYISLKGTLGYQHLRYADEQNTNPTYSSRNLSFNNHTGFLSVSGVFHFLRYAPGYEGGNFTPYISLGAGILYSEPYAKPEGKKYMLRKLGTEGQYSTLPHEGKKYSALVAIFPLSVGLKKAVSERLAFFAEGGYHFTTTDYLDDVSATYAGVEAFLPQNYKGSNADAALLLQDRSATHIGRRGLQRGSSLVKDGYFTAQVGISYNLSTCNCPGVY